MSFAPRHVYSAIVKNESGKDITVKATYHVPTAGMSIPTPEVVEVAIAAGAEGIFAEKNVAIDEATFVANIASFEVVGGVKNKGPFVDSPARDVVFVVAADLTIAKKQ